MILNYIIVTHPIIAIKNAEPITTLIKIIFLSIGVFTLNPPTPSEKYCNMTSNSIVTYDYYKYCDNINVSSGAPLLIIFLLFAII